MVFSLPQRSSANILSCSLSNRRDNQDRYRRLCAAPEWVPLQAEVWPRAAVQPEVSVPEPHRSWVQHSLPLAPTAAWHLPDPWPGVHLPAVPLQQLHHAGARAFPYDQIFLQAKCWQGRSFLKLMVNWQRHEVGMGQGNGIKLFKTNYWKGTTSSWLVSGDLTAFHLSWTGCWWEERSCCSTESGKGLHWPEQADEVPVLERVQETLHAETIPILRRAYR